ncbi:hypothetical protein [Cellulosimicrobium cellulans]|uniref:hypothetical protein n=1 Tax=Cellulosimicrobium cellulans TaxID=1710 RepID=UPI000A7A6F41|nr:hypothetical protein [Cellulosimicrobium cellulans]
MTHTEPRHAAQTDGPAAPYVAGPARRTVDAEALRARIPGWGADLDPKDRPSFPREVYDPAATGAHWDFPERQPELAPRERSIEHAMLPPVFGTSAPLHGASGAVRRLAYGRFSEGRAAHWLLLLAADRVDAVESHLRSFATTRPDNPVTETGVLSEGKAHGIRSRRGRVDVRHQVLDPVIVAGPWLAAAGAGVWAVRAVVRRARR